MNLKELSAVSE